MVDSVLERSHFRGCGIEASPALFGGLDLKAPEAHVAVSGHVELVKEALVPWTARHMYLNFAETTRSAESFWSEQAYARLKRIKAAVDPTGRMRANHPVTSRS